MLIIIKVENVLFVTVYIIREISTTKILTNLSFFLKTQSKSAKIILKIRFTNLCAT